MKRCADIRALLPGYVEDELDHATAQAVASHLAGCAECRTEDAAHRAAGALLRAPRTTPEPGNLYAGFVAKLADTEARERRSLVRLRWATAACTLVLCLGAGSVWLRHADDTPPLTGQRTVAPDPLSVQRPAAAAGIASVPPSGEDATLSMPAPGGGAHAARAHRVPMSYLAPAVPDEPVRAARRTEIRRPVLVTAPKAPLQPPVRSFEVAGVLHADAHVMLRESLAMTGGRRSVDRSSVMAGEPGRFAPLGMAGPARGLAGSAGEALVPDAAMADFAVAPRPEVSSEASRMATMDMDKVNDRVASARIAPTAGMFVHGDLVMQPELDERLQVDGTETRIMSSSGWDRDGNMRIVRIDLETIDLGAGPIP